MTPPTKEQIQGFVNGVAAILRAHYAANFPNLTPPVPEAQYGSKRVRIVVQGAFCFIDLANGDILKAASWAAPAKHARGTIHTPTFGVEHVGPYGPAYLR